MASCLDGFPATGAVARVLLVGGDIVLQRVMLGLPLEPACGWYALAEGKFFFLLLRNVAPGSLACWAKVCGRW
eukprot:8337431-Prorocentrum_lima.AAC.1